MKSKKQSTIRIADEPVDQAKPVAPDKESAAAEQPSVRDRFRLIKNENFAPPKPVRRVPPFKPKLPPAA